MLKQRGLPLLGRAVVVRVSPQVDRASPVLSMSARINPSLDRVVVRLPYAGLGHPHDALEVGQQTVTIRKGFLPRLTRAGDETLAVLLALVRSRCWSNYDRWVERSSRSITQRSLSYAAGRIGSVVCGCALRRWRSRTRCETPSRRNWRDRAVPVPPTFAQSVFSSPIRMLQPTLRQRSSDATIRLTRSGVGWPSFHNCSGRGGEAVRKYHGRYRRCASERAWSSD